MKEVVEREQTNIRLDPSLKLIMKGFKKVMCVSSVDDVYEQAVLGFIRSNPELADQVQTLLVSAASPIQEAITTLECAVQTLTEISSLEG